MARLVIDRGSKAKIVVTYRLFAHTYYEGNDGDHRNGLCEKSADCLAVDQENAEILRADFSALFKRYAPDVFRFALYLSGNHSEAEDITSETFVRAWTAPGRIEVATVKAYLFTIARNLFLHELRKRARNTGLDEELRDPQPGPQIQAEQKAELQVVLAKLQKLPETDRTALLMRALESIPYEEIARVLKISVTAAKVKVHRARAILSNIHK